MSRPCNWLLLAGLVALGLGRGAHAQSFPPAGAWVPLPCGNGVMTSAVNDTPGATGPLDLVGVDALPAGFHAADASFLYLRMRVAGNPITGAKWMADAWGYELNLDGSRNTYQLLFSVSGIGNADQVAIYRHTSTAAPGDPADPADLPPLFTYPAATNARASAAGSNLGGGQDYFIDMALPWADLATSGLRANSAVSIWAGSSTVANALNLDLACFSGPGGRLGGIPVGVTTPDPQFAGGGPGNGTGPRTLEGGPGCSLFGSARRSSDIVALSLALSLLVVARVRSRRS